MKEVTGLNRIVKISLLLVLSAWLLGCASPAVKEAFVVQQVSMENRHPHSVSVITGGGGDREDSSYSEITNQDLADAIKESIGNTGLFSSVVQGDGADYKLSVTLVNMSKPMFGVDFKIDMEMAWSLVNAKTGEVAMRESITSSHTATMGDAFVGVTRFRLAVEGATKDNISQGMKKISGLSL